MPNLFDPLRLDDLKLPNWIVMAPLTRWGKETFKPAEKTSIIDMQGLPQRSLGNYPLLFSGGASSVWGAVCAQARTARIVLKGSAPFSLAVSTAVLTLASALAAHMAR
jgi:hypothetical protein